MRSTGSSSRTAGSRRSSTTLGTLAIFRVLLVELSGSKTVTTESLPAWIVDLPRTTLFSIGDFDVRPLVVIAIVVAVVFQLVLRYLPFGRRLFAIGSNPDAAQLVGMPVRRDVFTAFVLSGALAGLAGFMFLSRFGNITVAAGLGLELQAVAAVVVGGVAIFGGVGSIVGAVIGAFLIDLLSQSLTRMPSVSRVRARRDPRRADPAGGRQRQGRRGAAASRPGRRPRRRSWPGAKGRRPLAELARRRARGRDCSSRCWSSSSSPNAAAVPGYLNPQNQVNLLQLSIEKAIVALAMTFVIIGGEIDLSVASIMGLSAILFAWSIDHGIGPEVALLLALLAGLLCGLNNAFWVARVGLPSLAVTLAGLIGYRGLALMLIEDGSLGGFPDWFERLGQGAVVGPLPFAVVLFVALLVLAGLVLHRTGFGRTVFVIGNSADVARFSGVNVPRVKFAHVRHVRPRGRPGRSVARGPVRVRSGQRRAGLRARHHHDRAVRRREHLRRPRQHGRRRCCRSS